MTCFYSVFPSQDVLKLIERLKNHFRNGTETISLLFVEYNPAFLIETTDQFSQTI